MLGHVAPKPHQKPIESQEVHSNSQTQTASTKTKAKELFENQLENICSRHHYEAVLTPKTEDHVRFLRNCTSFQGSLEFGKVHANLDPRFWSFVHTVDESIVVQSYIDAVLLSGEHSSASADSKTLLEQSGVPSDLTQEQMAQIGTDQKNANHCLNLIHEKKSNSCSPFKKHVSRTLRKQYFAATSGGELKKDYAVYCRAQNFKDKLLSIAKPQFVSRSQANLQNMLRQSGHDAANITIALSRLQRLHDQQLSA